MRRCATGIGCLLAIVLPACGAGIDAFDIPLTQTGVLPGLGSSIPGAGGVNMAGAGGQVKQTIRNKGVSAEWIQSTTLTKADLVLLKPPGSTLAWLAGLRIFVSAPDLPRVQVAHIDDVQGDGPTYPLVLDALELKPYVTAPELTIEPVFDTPQARLLPDHEVRLDLTLHVDGAFLEG